MLRGLLLFLFLIIGQALCAAPVSLETARTAASHFWLAKTGMQQALKTEFIDSYQPLALLGDYSTYTCFYIFTADNGFVIISGDDRVAPVLGYSTEDNFHYDDMASATDWLLNGYRAYIYYQIKNNIEPTAEITRQWQQLLSGKPDNRVAAITVAPMLPTLWDQRRFFNSQCPYDSAHNELTVTGCVATAMAQVMRYWNHPARGTGSYTYTLPKYGTLTANFDTAYRWDLMPGKLWFLNSAVSTLMLHCGISVNMRYGVASTGGSSAPVIAAQSSTRNCTEYALKNYFGYKTNMQPLERVNYYTNEWMALVKTDLDAHRPIIYAGFGGGGGHCFVADGYDDRDYIHINWGWGGLSNGYFSIENLDPTAIGTGGGWGGYNLGQYAIFGLEPDYSTGINDVQIPAPFSIYPNPAKEFITVSFNNPETVSRIKLYDMQGRIVNKMEAGDQTITLPVSPLAQGIYYLSVETSKGVWTEKMVVE